MKRFLKCWHIHFENGYAIECYRLRKPVRLAVSWSRKRAGDGSVYGSYRIVGGF